MNRKRIVESSSSASEEDSSDSGDEYVPSKTARRSGGGVRRLSGTEPQQQQQQSQGSVGATSQLASQCTDLSQEEFARLAGLVANYFLAAECKKVPVKRADLGKVVGKQHTRRLPPIVEEASVLLQKIYGYKVVELAQRKNCYLLMNSLAPPINDITTLPMAAGGASGGDSEDTEDDRDDELKVASGDERQGLLFVVLTVIFMMGGVVEEVTLFSFLKCLGVYVDSKDPHPVFGSCKKLLEEFGRQAYLDVTTIKDVEPTRKEYSWGERAHLQVCKRAVLEFVCKVYGGGMRPQNWVDHWSKVVGAIPSAASSSVGSSVEEIIMEEPVPMEA